MKGQYQNKDHTDMNPTYRIQCEYVSKLRRPTKIVLVIVADIPSNLNIGFL